MSDKYTLKEVSELFGVNKSTLRFWERKGILQSNRNIENDYREYTKDDLLKISDILHYRFANYSIKDLKTIDFITLEENKRLLEEIQQQISDKKEELDRIEKRISKQLTNVHALQEMLQGDFLEAEPDFNTIYHLHVSYRDNVLKYTNDHSLLSTVIGLSDLQTKHFGILSQEDEGVQVGEIMWKKNIDHRYYPLLLKIKGKDIDQDCITSAIEKYGIAEQTIIQIVSRFMIQDHQYSYYKAWIETKE